MPTYYDPRTGQIIRTAQPLKRQTNVDISQDPGTNYNTSGPGASPTGTTPAGSAPPPIPSATPVPNPPGGSVGTGGGGTVNAAGGNISQGAIYGGTVNNTASGGTGSLDSSGGSGNVYRETTSAPPAAGPAPSPTPNPNAECGMDKPCPDGKFCKMGTCEPIPDDAGGNPPGDMSALMSTAPRWNSFMSSYMRGN